MKKTNLRGKLALDRETLHALQPDVLDGVNGGTSVGPIVRTIVQATRNLCPKVSAADCTTVTTAASHPTITCKPAGQ
jgi:hypothetical protein